MSDTTTSKLEPPRLAWTAEQTANVLSVTSDVIKNLHRVGQLRGVKIGRSLRWRPEDVRKFVDNLGMNGASDV